jgi:hypothetical protein
MKSELMPKSDDEITLRELLAYAYAGASLYTDDGELQDSRRHPFIDFLRDSPDDIAAKMRQRGKAALDAAGGEQKILSDSARRAEIGRLVEELAKRPKGGLWVLEREDGKFFVDCDRTPPGSVIEAATLLDALRLLAAECQIPEKP